MNVLATRSNFLSDPIRIRVPCAMSCCLALSSYNIAGEHLSSTGLERTISVPNDVVGDTTQVSV